MNIYIVIGHDAEVKNVHATTDKNILVNARPKDYGSDCEYLTIETWNNGVLESVSDKIWEDNYC